MKEISRFIQTKIEEHIGKQKVIMLYGSRRTGKTTIIEKIAEKFREKVLMLLGEDMVVAEMLQLRTVENYKNILGNKTLLIIDEAHAIPNIGKILKLMIDGIKGLTIIVTGSSSFDLVYDTGEPLVGRNIVFHLFPLAQIELSMQENRVETKQKLDQRLIYGSYPELWHINNNEARADYLKQLVNSYLLKDILTYASVKGPDVLFKLMRLLAYQVGNEVSTPELGKNLQLNRETVERYLDLLSKIFIIYPLSGFSRSLRKEVTKSKKWYFYDNGIRNALIQDFRPLALRNDIGQLWEQYILSERIKYNTSRNSPVRYFFWRTYDGQEIDLIEQNDFQQLGAFECKWTDNKVKIPAAFSRNYPDAEWHVINRANYLEWIL